VKRSGRDEPFQLVIHICMEAVLGISLYSCLYLKLAKMLCLSYYLLCLLFNKIGAEGRTGSAWKRGGVEEQGKRGGGQDGQYNVCTYEQMNKQ
jgi:hypothetical protein